LIEASASILKCKARAARDRLHMSGGRMHGELGRPLPRMAFTVSMASSAEDY
jgi:hypothetical protein